MRCFGPRGFRNRVSQTRGHRPRLQTSPVPFVFPPTCGVLTIRMGPIQKTVGIELVDGQLRVAVLQSRFGKLSLVQSAEITDFEQLSIEDKTNSLSVLVKEHGLQH